MAPYTGSVKFEKGYIYAPYVPITKVIHTNVRGTPWNTKKRKFAFFPKTVTSGLRIWFKRYVVIEELQYGPLDFPPLTLGKILLTEPEFTFWALTNDIGVRS